MAHYPGLLTPHHCLDEEFDAPDIAADHDLCRALVAGKAGLHPDVWSDHDPLPLRWLLRRRHEPAPVAEVLPVDPVWEAEHRRRPVDWPKPKPRPKPDFIWRERTTTRRPTYPVSDHTTGEVQLTCDECRKVRFRHTVPYGESGRLAAVVVIRAMGREVGWTCIVGRDRCPKCSQVPPPQAKGNGASPHQGNEQHR